MRIRKVVNRRLRRSSPGEQVAGDVQATIAVNLGEPGEARTSAEQHVRVVQRTTGSPPATPGRDDSTEGDTNG